MKMLVDGESIGEGRLTVDSAPVDLTDVLRRTFDSFETQARAKDVRLRIESSWRWRSPGESARNP